MSSPSIKYPKSVRYKGGFRRDVYTESGELSLYYDPDPSKTLLQKALRTQKELACRSVTMTNKEVLGYGHVIEK